MSLDIASLRSLSTVRLNYAISDGVHQDELYYSITQGKVIQQMALSPENFFVCVLCLYCETEAGA